MKPIRVALSGSGFKFPAHAGALLAIRDAGFEPIEYAGTSGGSLVAAIAAAGTGPYTIRDICMNTDWSSMLQFNPTALWRGGFCNGNNLESMLEMRTWDRTFRQLRTDLTIVASDVCSETPFIFSRKNTPDVAISRAGRASASIPLVFQPVRVGKALLMDGGMIDNIPADLLIQDDVPRLGVQLVSTGTPFDPSDTKLTAIVPRLLDLMLTATENAHRAIAQQSGAKFAFVETGFAGGLDRNMSYATRKQLLDAGYRATAEALAGM